tara:strand:+ start:1398 stop:1859 length:462 start_codon:yes stop_codon:yes gene_type:complete
MNTQHIVQLLQQALQELHTQQHAQTPVQPAAVAVPVTPATMATATAADRGLTRVIDLGGNVKGTVGSLNGGVFDPVQKAATGQLYTGFYMDIEGCDSCFVKAYEANKDVLMDAGLGATFTGFLKVTPNPKKRNPWRTIENVQITGRVEKVVQF